MLTQTRCLNCSFTFEGEQCPLCSWEPDGLPANRNQSPRITLVFEYQTISKDEELQRLTATAHHFAEIQGEYGTRYFATFLPHQASELFRLFRKIEDGHRLQVLIDGKVRPYSRTLWLPLLWFFEENNEA